MAGVGAGAGASGGSDRLQELLSRARQCLAWDPNEALRRDTQALIDGGDEVALEEAFGTKITFGTAGLRGPMRAGLAFMNDLTVLQATQGMCQYLADTEPEYKTRGVAIGYDHRRTSAVSSKQFALLAAAVFLSRGVKVYLMGDIVCTPLVPFTVDTRNCCAGIVVTASHNPKEDNGYKVYWGNGAMIIPPVDAGILKSIMDNLEPWQEYDYSEEAVLGSELCLEQRAELGQLYIDTMAEKLCRRKEANAASDVPIAYTAMHGVGQEWVMRAFNAFGHAEPVATPQQAKPDPDFPTVAYPNPEEGKGALALAIETATSAGAKLILANDPDADRLAVAEIQGDGSCRVFKGDEIGLLLGNWEWRCWREANPDADPKQVAMLASTVSSKVLSGMAKAEGFVFEDTLTGHKWLGNRAVQLRAAGKQVLFAYEEAIGFCIGDLVKDKDGVTAAAVFAEFYKAILSEGFTVASYLESLYARYGYFVSQNGYLFTPDSSVIDRIFLRLRNDGKYWIRCGDFTIADIRDLETPGVDTSTESEKPTMPVSSSHMITYYFRNGCIATIRPSGTEPKIKYYIEMPGSNPDDARATLSRVAAAVIEHMLQPSENNLSAKKSV